MRTGWPIPVVITFGSVLLFAIGVVAGLMVRQEAATALKPGLPTTAILVGLLLSLLTLGALKAYEISRVRHWARTRLGKAYADVIEHQIGELSRLGAQSNQILASSGRATEGLRKLESNVMESLVSLNKKIDADERRIRELEEGQHFQIAKRILRGFAKLETIFDDPRIASETERLEQLREMLAEALAEWGVEKFSPEIGADYRTEKGVADNPRRIKTQDRARHLQIASVVSVGYSIKTDAGGEEVLFPARVEIFVAEEV